MLLTLAGKVENQGMGWNADRTSVGDQWGHGPTVAEGIPATVTLKTDAARPCLGAGRDRQARGGRARRPSRTAQLTFTVGPQFKTLWYEIGAPGDAGLAL